MSVFSHPFSRSRTDSLEMTQGRDHREPGIDGVGTDEASPKTFIGKIEKLCDFLGYRFSSAGLAVSRQTIERWVARMSQLYEHGANMVRMGTYLGRVVWSGFESAVNIATFGATTSPYNIGS